MSRGRPPKYSPEYAEEARRACEAGATDVELADLFSVDVRTISRWRHQHPEFCQAMVLGKNLADDRVERALYQRAVGYEKQVEKAQYDRDRGEWVRTTITEQVEPNVAAAEIWLRNRRPGKWRDQLADDGDDLEEMSDEELEAVYMRTLGEECEELQRRRAESNSCS